MPNIIDYRFDKPLAKAVITCRFEIIYLTEMTITIFKRISMMTGLLLLTITMTFADAKPHKIAFHVDEE